MNPPLSFLTIINDMAQYDDVSVFHTFYRDVIECRSLVYRYRESTHPAVASEVVCRQIRKYCIELKSRKETYSASLPVQLMDFVVLMKDKSVFQTLGYLCEDNRFVVVHIGNSNLQGRDKDSCFPTLGNSML